MECGYGKTKVLVFRMTVLTDLKLRGVEDILITATDNLNGFTQTIRSVFPQSQTQICVVNQFRNALNMSFGKAENNLQPT